MKALLLKEYSDFVYQEVPEPQVHEDEVLFEGACLRYLWQ